MAITTKCVPVEAH
jgi:hypothetical protein